MIGKLPRAFAAETKIGDVLLPAMNRSGSLKPTHRRTRMPRSLIAALATFALAGVAAGAEPPKIDRTLKKEPAYKTKAPKYGMLTFGPEAKDRVWLVLDGDTLYADRNGNGDLTEPGEKIAAEKKAGHDPEEDGYAFEVGAVSVGGRTHKGLRVYFTPL